MTTDPLEDVVPSWSRGRKVDLLRLPPHRRLAGLACSRAGGPEEQITHLGGFAAFESFDGKVLYYAKGRSEAGLWRKTLPDGPEQVYLPELKAGFWGYFAVAEKGIYFLDWAGPGNPAGLFFQGATRHQMGTVDGPPAVADSGLRALPRRPPPALLAGGPGGQRHPDHGTLPQIAAIMRATRSIPIQGPAACPLQRKSAERGPVL